MSFQLTGRVQSTGTQTKLTCRIISACVLQQWCLLAPRRSCFGMCMTSSPCTFFVFCVPSLTRTQLPNNQGFHTYSHISLLCELHLVAVKLLDTLPVYRTLQGLFVVFCIPFVTKLQPPQLHMHCYNTAVEVCLALCCRFEPQPAELPWQISG